MLTLQTTVFFFFFETLWKFFPLDNANTFISKHFHYCFSGAVLSSKQAPHLIAYFWVVFCCISCLSVFWHMPGFQLCGLLVISGIWNINCYKGLFVCERIRISIAKLWTSWKRVSSARYPLKGFSGFSSSAVLTTRRKV